MKKLLLALLLWGTGPNYLGGPHLALATPSRACDGTDDSLRSTADVITASPLGILVWFRPGALSTTKYLVGSYASGSTHHYGLAINSTDHPTAVSSDGTNASATLATSVALNTWTALGGSYDNDSLRSTMQDGDTAGVVSNTTAKTPLSLVRMTACSRDVNTPNNFANGVLGPYFIYNTALSNEDRVAFSKGISPFKIRPHGIVLGVPYPGHASAQNWFGANPTINGSAATSVEVPHIQSFH